MFRVKKERLSRVDREKTTIVMMNARNAIYFVSHLKYWPELYQEHNKQSNNNESPTPENPPKAA